MESALGYRLFASLLLGDQACYWLDSQSGVGDGMELVSGWVGPGPAPCRGAIGGSMERKARALTLLSAHLSPSILGTWLEQ